MRKDRKWIFLWCFGKPEKSQRFQNASGIAKSKNAEDRFNQRLLNMRMNAL